MKSSQLSGVFFFFFCGGCSFSRPRLHGDGRIRPVDGARAAYPRELEKEGAGYKARGWKRGGVVTKGGGPWSGLGRVGDSQSRTGRRGGRGGAFGGARGWTRSQLQRDSQRRT